MDMIRTWHSRVPMLGICLGHQALGMYFGARLKKAPYPMHGKVSSIHTRPHPMWAGIPATFPVCRYHSLYIEAGEESVLEVTAISDDDRLAMAFAHKSLPLWGIQFHPEAILTEYGKELLNNWLKTFNLH